MNAKLHYHNSSNEQSPTLGTIIRGINRRRENVGKKNHLLWETEELRCVSINVLRKCEASLELARRHLDTFKE